ncbi:MAG TPA: hypothetical protein VFM24_00255 [Nitrospira sp.]|nr:hypothetical protein [Nitrospira sp.]
MEMGTGCDKSDKISSAVLETHATGETVIEFTKTALKTIGYDFIPSTERTDGGSRTIHGERMGMVTAIGPAKVHIKIVITSAEKGSEIKVDVIPPRGAYGSSELPLHDYQYALSQVMPDLTLKSKTVPRTFF